MENKQQETITVFSAIMDAIELLDEKGLFDHPVRHYLWKSAYMIELNYKEASQRGI